uniref:HD domain-containing protein n=1 Tax=viral metagenome TaxID=1070528 RepID=A0A6C0ED82_9ZZZZ
MSKKEVIRQLFEKNGASDYIGEDITQLEHALQTGTLAANEHSDNDMILACFLHDIGHIIDLTNDMDGYGKMNHETIGADFLRKLGFNERICWLVSQHVNSKRYLCTLTKDYINSLSHASQETFKRQGGFMTPEEIKDFTSNLDYKLALQLRYYDDNGKIIGSDTKSLDFFLDLID